MKRILLIGTLSNKAKNYVTGQSVIFDGIVDYFAHKYHVEVISLTDNGKYQRGSLMFTVNRVLQFLAIYLKLIWIVVFKKIDVVYYQTALSVFGIKRDSITVGILRLFRIPIVAHQFGNIHIKTFLKDEPSSLQQLEKLVSRLDKVIVEGDGMVPEYEQIGTLNENIVVIPNGYKEENAIEKSPKSYNKTDTFKVFYLSNLIYSKGYFDVLRAIDLLVNKKRADVSCCFAGKFYKGFEKEDNNEELGTPEAFERFVEEHSLRDKVTYVPGLFGKEKAEQFQESHVFILPTYYSGEGQPMSILEAMSYGCVPIVTKHGHIPMMVNEENGSIVEAQNPSSIADAIFYLMNHAEEYHSKSQRSIADFKEKFTYERFVQSIESCLVSSMR